MVHAYVLTLEVTLTQAPSYVIIVQPDKYIIQSHRCVKWRPVMTLVTLDQGVVQGTVYFALPTLTDETALQQRQNVTVMIRSTGPEVILENVMLTVITVKNVMVQILMTVQCDMTAKLLMEGYVNVRHKSFGIHRQLIQYERFVRTPMKTSAYFVRIRISFGTL